MDSQLTNQTIDVVTVYTPRVTVYTHHQSRALRVLIKNKPGKLKKIKENYYKYVFKKNIQIKFLLVKFQ